MKTQLQDVIHLYLGCEVQYKNILKNGEVCVETLTPQLLSKLLVNAIGGYVEIKPILRPLALMTEEEYAEYGRINYKKDGIKDFDNAVIIGKNLIKFNQKCDNPFECTLYLLKQGLDLFGLIDSQQAISANPIN